MDTADGDSLRESVLNTAVEAWEEKGYAATSMRDVARRCRLSLNDLYRVFPSREAIVFALYERLNDLAIARFRDQETGTGDLSSHFRRLLEIKLELLEPHRAALTAIFREAVDPESDLSPFSSASAATRERSVALFREMLSRDGDTEPVADAGPVAEGLWLLHLVLILAWLHDRTESARITRELVERAAGVTAMLPTLVAVAVAELVGAADLEAGGLVVDGGFAPAAAAEVDGVGVVDVVGQRCADGVPVARGHQGQIRNRSKRSDVFVAVVGRAVKTHGDAAVGADHFDGEVGVADVVSDVLDAHQGEEEGVVRDDGRQTRGREAGRGADHVALGDAEVEVAVRVCSPEVHHLGRPAEIGGADDDLVVAGVREVEQGLSCRELLRESERRHHVPGRVVERFGDGRVGCVDILPEIGAHIWAGHPMTPFSISA